MGGNQEEGGAGEDAERALAAAGRFQAPRSGHGGVQGGDQAAGQTQMCLCMASDVLDCSISN